MSEARKADVIVTISRDEPTDLRCLQSVLEHSGSALGRVILVLEDVDVPELLTSLTALALNDHRMSLLRNWRPLGKVESLNRGLAERQGDAVLLRGYSVVTPGWLVELAEVAHAEERTACVAPLSNGGGLCSVPSLDVATAPNRVEPEVIRAACAGLPRWTEVPRLSGSCVYLRGDVLDAVGLLDSGFASVSACLDDWVMRALAFGFVAKRANRVFVHQLGLCIDPPATDCNEGSDSALIDSRYPYLADQVARFRGTLDASLAARATDVMVRGKLPVAYDLRHLPREQVGTRTYAVCLATALGTLPEVELTLLVRDPVQARGLAGRVITEDDWRDDVAVIHRPAQVIDPRDLRLLFESSAHIVITYLDLIGYRIPLVFPEDQQFHQYRATSRLSLQAVQRILAISESSGAELAREFGIPRDEIGIVPLGVESDAFAVRESKDSAALRKLQLPSRYFFSVATDFPHKNLPNLLDAYAVFRKRWRSGDPPGLVLAGYATGARLGFYRRLANEALPPGVVYLGPVSSDQLRLLYQHAEALVYPSLYEGFGLPPLEAMSAGTAVIAMRFSAVPEVCGDAAFYPDGLSANDLARALEVLASDDGLRSDLRRRGKQRVLQFQWEKTARETLDNYRLAVHSPSARSLQMRRMLREAILCWSEPIAAGSELAPLLPHHPVHVPRTLGIRESWRSLNFAVQQRLRLELGRLRTRERKSA